MGLVRDYYISGQMQWQGKLVSEAPDINDSICTWYYESGQVQKSTSYQSGVMQGASREYYDNGQLESESHYANNRLDGRRTSYHATGKLKAPAFTNTESSLKIVSHTIRMVQ